MVFVAHNPRLKVMCFVLQPNWSLLVVNTGGSLHCKQGSIILQLPVVFSTTPTYYHRNWNEMENINAPIDMQYVQYTTV